MRDLDCIDVQRALRASGLRIRFLPVRPDAGWLYESLEVVARRAVGVGILRRSMPRN